MPDTPITQAGMDRLEAHLVGRDEALKEFLLAVIQGNDRRYEQQFTDGKSAVNAALNAAKEAVTKAETAAEKRFEGVNEFRASLSDQQRTLMPRTEAEQRFSDMSRQITELKEARIVQGGKEAGAMNLWGFIIGGVGIMAALITLALRFI